MVFDRGSGGRDSFRRRDVDDREHEGVAFAFGSQFVAFCLGNDEVDIAGVFQSQVIEQHRQRVIAGGHFAAGLNAGSVDRQNLATRFITGEKFDGIGPMNLKRRDGRDSPDRAWRA